MSEQCNQFSNLLAPITIGKTSFKNRICMAPMGGPYGTLHGARGEYSDAALQYFMERARGGFGIIFGGAIFPDNSVDPPDMANALMMTYPDTFIRSGLRLNEELAYHGAKMIQQVSVGLGRNYEGLYSCSATEIFEHPEKLSPVLSHDQIKQKIDWVVKGAELMKRSGFAGVEIHAMHWGYLLDQFAMSLTNHRQDEYGGCLENRMRICREIAEGVRQVCGDGFVLSMRLGLKSYMPALNQSTLHGENEAGRTLEESVQIARMLETYGYDVLNVDVGTYDSFQHACAPMYMPQGHVIPLAAEVKKAVGIPVLCGSRMNDPAMGEKAVAEGKIDGIVLGRPALADPYYAKKVEMGTPEKIRPCLGCNTCHYAIQEGGEYVHCAVNPQLQREIYYYPRPALVKKTVAVIGGGIAGMEAARTAKMRGHDVTIYEKGSTLGGLLIPASSHSFKPELAQLLNWYKNEIAALGIPVKYNCAMDAEGVKALRPDVALVATGSAPVMPRLPGIDHPKCKSGVEVLSAHPDLGKKVVVVGGGLVGCETAIDYAMQGKEVTLVEAADAVLAASKMIAPGVRRMVPQLLEEYHVKVMAGHKIEAVNDVGAAVSPVSGGARLEIEADTVVMSIGMRPIPNFSKDLIGSGIEVREIGDSRQVGNVYTCIHCAYDVACAL